MKKFIIDKGLIILMFIILFVYILLSIINIFDNSSYIVFETGDVIKVNKNNINVYKNTKKINYSNAKLYKDNKKTNGYLEFSSNEDNNIVKFYSEKMKEEKTNNSFIVVGKAEIKDYSYLIKNDTTEEDTKLIRNYLKDNSLPSINDLTTINKAIVDDKTFYEIRNYYYDKTGKNNLALILLKQDDDIKQIYVKEGKNVLKRSSKLSKIIDLNGDNEFELILQSAPFGTDSEYCNSVYMFDKSKGEYKPIINCEGE